MSFYSLWPTNIQIEDNFLPDSEFLKIKEFMYAEFKRQKKFPLINFDQDRLPPEVEVFKRCLLSVFEIYCQNGNENSSQFSLGNFQVHQVTKYNEALSHEHIMHTHHDQAEGGYYAITYYLNVADPSDVEYLGGELAIYKNATSADYPDGIVYVKPKENRLVIFPAFLNHVVRPYFSDNPRMTIAILMNKSGNYNQNKRIRVLE